MAKRKKSKAGQEDVGFYDDDGNWVDLELGDSKKKKGLNTTKAKIIGIGTGLAILAATSAYFISVDNAKPKAQKKEERQVDHKIEKKQVEVVGDKIRDFRKTVKVDTTHVATIRDFSEDILKLNSKIYSAVRLLGKESSMSTLKESGTELSNVVIVLIEIDIRAKPWNALNSDDRIQLLHDTYSLLKESYPDITRQVRLVFNDAREPLEFEFDKMFS